MSCQRHCSTNPRSVGRIHAILLLRRRARLPCRKIRLQIRCRFPRTARNRLPCYLLAHRLGERPISISLGSLVSHRHLGSSSKETYYAGDGFCSVDIHRVLVHSNLLGVHRARNDDRRHAQRVPVENRVRPPSLRSARRAGGRAKVFAGAVTAIEDAGDGEALWLARPTPPTRPCEPELRCVWVAQLRTELRTVPTKTGCVAGLAPITSRSPANSRSRVRAVAP